MKTNGMRNTPSDAVRNRKARFHCCDFFLSKKVQFTSEYSNCFIRKYTAKMPVNSIIIWYCSMVNVSVTFSRK